MCHLHFYIEAQHCTEGAGVTQGRRQPSRVKSREEDVHLYLVQGGDGVQSSARAPTWEWGGACGRQQLCRRRTCLTGLQGQTPGSPLLWAGRGALVFRGDGAVPRGVATVGGIGLTLSTPPAPPGPGQMRSLSGWSPDHPAVGHPHIGRPPGRNSPGLACRGRAT